MRIADLEFFDMGDIIDLIIERGNDNCEYDYVANQKDIDKLLG